MCIWLRCNRGIYGAFGQKGAAVFRHFMAWAGRRGGLFAGGLACRKTITQRLITLLSAAILSSNLLAFEENGHIMVAQLMMPFLNDGAKVELARLYGDDWSREVVNLAASVQSELNRPKNSHLKSMQQTLFDIDAEGFDPQANCPNNSCSVAAILESRQVLLKTTFADSDKRQAIIYLLHYVLQLHIPVNSGLKRDMGGEKIYLKDDELQPVNFAWIWNYDLYRLVGKRWFSYAQELYRKMEQEEVELWAESLMPQDWAFEAHKIAIEQAYPLAAEGRYSANLINESTEILEQQLMKAAYRSAALLNSMLDAGNDEGVIDSAG